MQKIPVGHHNLWQLINASPRQRELGEQWLGEKSKELLSRIPGSDLKDKLEMESILGISPFSEVGEPDMNMCSHKTCKHDESYNDSCICACHLPKPKDSEVCGSGSGIPIVAGEDIKAGDLVRFDGNKIVVKCSIQQHFSQEKV